MLVPGRDPQEGITEVPGRLKAPCGIALEEPAAFLAAVGGASHVG